MKYLSPIISQARASLGAATFSRNRGGNYIKSKPIPLQPRTPSQQLTRSNMSTASSAWRLLTPTQREGWNSLAAQYNYSDSLGTAYRPSGAQLFTGLYINSLNLSNTPPFSAVGTPPTVPAPAIDDIFIVTLSSSIALTMASSIPVGGYMVVRATSPRSAGTFYFSRSWYRTIEVLADGSTPPTPAALYTLYTNVFGAPDVGNKVSWYVQYYDANNYTGQPTFYTSPVT